MSEAGEQRDPFTLVMERLWQALEGEGTFAELVPPGNRVKFTEADPWRDSLTTANCPEVAIIQSAAPSNEHATFGSETTRQDYEISVITGSMHLELLNRIKWGIFKAIARLEGRFTSPTPLAFVYNVEIGQFSDGLAGGTQGQRAPRGWVSTVPVSVRMQFERDDL